MTISVTSRDVLSAKQAQDLLSKGQGWPGMKVEGLVQLKNSGEALRLPDNLEVEALDLSQCPGVKRLPSGLHCFEINASNTQIQEVPKDLHVDSILNLSGCEELTRLPKGLKVGTLNLQGCRSLAGLPENLDVWFLNMTGCWNFKEWPRQAAIRSGRLTLRGCTALTGLPAYLGTLAALNVRDCPNLRELPDSLKITGWIDVAQSGLAESKKLPLSLRGVDLRWQGVRIDERILLKPETITVDEVLAERNAERRRVLLDRFGVSRFMKETQAKVLDEDTDPGGPRQLLRVELKDDEPLVTLACFCPSTARQYFLRVPPNMESCHQAAAWIAGFDNPRDYQPLLET
jgi:hypothetical protein